jgi:pyridoxal phosphate phosphatase PHOSPHO2
MALQNILVVFDFDCSLVLEDSDSLVLKTLAPDFYQESSSLYRSEESPYQFQWASLMNYFINRLMNERNVTLDMINEVLVTMPYDSDVIESIKLAAAAVERGTHQNVTLIIISDANEYYIQTILQHLGILHLFSKIYTNFASILADEQNQKRLSITAYESQNTPHHCRNSCPKNLCKTKVLETFQKEMTPKEFHQILYIGDGSGDYCPVTSLRNENDIVLCRQDWALHRRLQESPPIKAKVIPWVDGKVIRGTFETIFGRPTAAPLAVGTGSQQEEGQGL